VGALPFILHIFVLLGPDTWWVHYPSSSGAKQSPVDILTEETAVDINYGSVPLQISYNNAPTMDQSTESLESSETKVLINTGSTARVSVVNSRSCMYSQFHMEDIVLYLIKYTIILLYVITYRILYYI